MKFIILNIHSFVDLITNSSSETYATANDKTVETVKNILKLFLENANVATSVDKLFDVKLVHNEYDYGNNNASPNKIEVEGNDPDQINPSRIKVSVKEGVTDFGELVKVLNTLNDAFSTEEFCS